MRQEKVERRNVSIYPSQWRVVESKARESGSAGNTSAGLRALIAEYQRLKANGKETPSEN